MSPLPSPGILSRGKWGTFGGLTACLLRLTLAEPFLHCRVPRLTSSNRGSFVSCEEDTICVLQQLQEISRMGPRVLWMEQEGPEYWERETHNVKNTQQTLGPVRLLRQAYLQWCVTAGRKLGLLQLAKDGTWVPVAPGPRSQVLHKCSLRGGFLFSLEGAVGGLGSLLSLLHSRIKVY